MPKILVPLLTLLTFAWGSVTLAEDSTSGLGSLILEGHELHPSLSTPQVDDYPIRHIPRHLVKANPYHSDAPDFVRVISRGGSQGNLEGEGVRSALYALYLGESELGFYGMEAESMADADRLEREVRKIWAHNASLDRARVHRRGLVLLVIWTDGVSPESWEAVNAVVAERLAAQ